MKSKLLTCILAGTMAVSLLAGCGGSSSDSGKTQTTAAADQTQAAGTGTDAAATEAADTGKAVAGGTMKIGSGQTCSNMDPTFNYNGWYLIRFGICQTLTQMTDDFGIEGWMAESYEPSEDNRVWSFTLKDGIVFSNGNPVDGNAVKSCLEFIFANSNRAPEESYFKYDSIEADGLKVIINCSQAEPILPNKLADPLFSIFDATDPGIDSREANGVIGSGPYVLESFDSTTFQTVVKRNDNYWGEKAPIDEVIFDYNEDQFTLTQALLSGEYDAVYNISMTDVEQFENNPDYKVSKAASGRTAHGFMNQNEGKVLADPVLRQALMMCLDKDTVCKTQLNAQYEAGKTPVTSAAPAYGFDSLEDPYAYNVDAAVKLLDDAGYKDTDGDGFREDPKGQPVDIKFTYYTGRPEQQIFVEALQMLAKQNIGIKITPDVHDTDTVMNMLDNGEYDMLMMSINVLNMADPENHFNEYFKAGGTHNAYGWDNAEFNKIMDELSQTEGADERAKLVTDASKILMDDAVCMYFCYPVINFTMKSNVTGIKQTPADYYWITDQTGFTGS